MTALVAQMNALSLVCRTEGGIEGALGHADLAPFAAAVIELWYANRAWEVVLDEGQQRWMRLWKSTKGSRFNGSGRGRGKSLFELAILDEGARHWATSKGRWCGLTGETAQGIISQAYDDYFVTCPKELKPQWAGPDLTYPCNGSLIYVIGTDAKSFRRARGQHRISVDVRDEYGFYQRPLEVDAALDAGVSIPGPSGEPGRVYYGTTPADSPAHESNAIAEAHKARGAYDHETLYDNPRADPEATIRGIMEKSGLTREEVLESTEFRREYKGERVVEEKRAAAPRWSKKKGDNPERHALVVDLETPEHVDFYVALDPGKTLDPHAALIAWWSFELQLLYFGWELEKPSAQTTTAEVAQHLKDLEAVAFGANSWNGTLLGAKWYQEAFREIPEYMQRKLIEQAPRQPYLRVGDPADLNMLKDLSVLHGIALLPARHHDKHLAVDNFNDMIGRGQVKVHPRCERLITQLGSTIWNKQRTEWERTPRDHGDLIDDAVDISRSLNKHRDPRPKHIDWAEAEKRRVMGLDKPKEWKFPVKGRR